MADLHPVTNADEPMFRALKLMEGRHKPTRYDREPYWRAPVTPASQQAYVPSWTWSGVNELPEGSKALTLDSNGAYLGGMTTVKIAHSDLKRTGSIAHHDLPAPRAVRPGYYLVKVPYWAFSGSIVSPLGNSARLETEDAVWIAHPTFILLLELLEEGSLGELVVFDSYTAKYATDFREWAAALKTVREQLLDDRDEIHPQIVPDKCTCPVKVPYWAFSGSIVSPLGNSARLETEDAVWIAHPTFILLLELLEEGSLGELVVFDSYTAKYATDFREWAAALKTVREQLLDDRDEIHPQIVPDKCTCPVCTRYNAFKEGYSAALSMMLTGDKCHTRRPDWAHAVMAGYAANQWRKAWRFQGTGHPILFMGHVDEITILAADLHEVLARPKPPFRYDQSGRALGALKVKDTATEVPEQTPDSIPVHLSEDIL